MKPGAFRLEFLIPGAATMAVAVWLVTELGLVHDPIGGAVEAVTTAIGSDAQGDAELSSATTLALLVIAGGFAYLIGIILVMLTFWWPVRQMIHAVRHARLRQLQELATDSNRDRSAALWLALTPVAEGTGNKQPWSKAAAKWLGGRKGWLTSEERWWNRLWRSTKPEHVGIALSAARQRANDAVLSEYEYRRYLRQLIAGVLPATVMFAGIPLIVEGALIARALAFLAAMGLVAAEMAAIHYQEQVGQALLLDVAYSTPTTPRTTDEDLTDPRGRSDGPPGSVTGSPYDADSTTSTGGG